MRGIAQPRTAHARSETKRLAACATEDDSVLQTGPVALGEFVDLRPPIPTHVDREALARGWLIYLVVMLAFAGLIFFLRDEPPTSSAAGDAAVAAAPKVPGKFGH
jgi:hypothetical protein